MNNIAVEKQIEELTKKIESLLKSSKQIIECNFYDCIDNWYTIHKKPNLCAGSNRSLRNVIRLLKKHIPNKQVYEMRPCDIEKCLNSLEANKTRKDIYIYSREFMRYAYYNKYIAEDISVFIKAPRYKAKEGTAYTQQQITTLFKHTKNKHVLNLFKFYYYTGVRKSEALTLRWCDIDFESKAVHIHGTKTISSNRYIPLTRPLQILLRSIPYTKADDLVFKVTDASIRWEIEHLKPKLNFNVNIKNFRTTFATRCADIGITARVVQGWLGHTDVRTTTRYYIKATPNFDGEQITLFNAKF